MLAALGHVSDRILAFKLFLPVGLSASGRGKLSDPELPGCPQSFREPSGQERHLRICCLHSVSSVPRGPSLELRESQPLCGTNYSRESEK